MAGLVPPAGVVTVTSTTPPIPPGGEVAVICVALFTVYPVAAVAPKVTAVAPVKFVPVITTDVPPCVAPEVGASPVTPGPGTVVVQIFPASAGARNLCPPVATGAWETVCIRATASGVVSVVQVDPFTVPMAVPLVPTASQWVASQHATATRWFVVPEVCAVQVVPPLVVTWMVPLSPVA